MMRVLVLLEIDNLNVASPIHLIAADETAALQLVEQRLDIAIVAGQNFDLDFLRSIFHPPAPVGHAPQADEQQARERIAVRQLLVLEESGFDVTGAHDASLR